MQEQTASIHTLEIECAECMHITIPLLLCIYDNENFAVEINYTRDLRSDAAKATTAST